MTGTIGRGGMGIVYAAEHALLGRPVAIKVLRSELSQRPEVVTRFFNEARAANTIRHPGIIEIYDFGRTPEGAAYLVMEYLEGETLKARSARLPFRWPAVLPFARQIAGALAAAHARGVVHRDLKPDNVFLVRDPEVPGGERIKLLDFGIAKLAVDSSSSVTVTHTGEVIGTPTYMAPEQCRGVAIDHRADLYSLGCLIYELCCGRPPFRGEGAGDVLAAHIHMPAPAMSTAEAEIPEGVEALVRRLLAKAPEDRLQAAQDVIFAIDAVRDEQTILMDPAASAKSAVAEPAVTGLSSSAMLPSQQPPARLRRSIAAVSTCMAAVTMVAATLVMRRGDDAGPTVPLAAAAQEPIRSASIATPVPMRCEPAVAPSREPDPPPALPLAVDATIDSAPAGAEVVLGGDVLGATPFRGQVPRADRDVKLVIRLAGYVERAIVVHATEPIHESVTLARMPHAVPPRRAEADRDRSINPFD
ncbi:MAG TPA: protein kinase [Kofleriaceae bacterium]